MSILLHDNGGGWNPRFVLYAKANGCTPEQQIERTHTPGGMSMGPFMAWIDRAWRASGIAPRGEADHVAFDAWLTEHYAEVER